MRKLYVLLPLTLFLVGCVSPSMVESDVISDLQLVSTRVELMEQELSQQIVENCGENIENLGSSLGKKIERLRRAKATTKVVELCTAKDVSKVTKGKLLLGAVEEVSMSKEGIQFNARIDTGADTSSIGVYGLKDFERDGKKWVKFSLASSRDAKVYEYPVFDTVRIKQSGDLTEDRIEVKVDIEMGGKKYKKQLFNLANRSYLDYQILIGRSFLRDIAIVDVSRKNLLRAQ